MPDGPKRKDEDLGNPYELLELEDDAGDKEIKTAYRKLSLKCHPDRNPDDPEAAEKFDRLTRAKDLLLDPIRRSEVDRERKAAKDLEARHAQEDAKRRKLREDLEGRESAANAKTQAAKAAAEAAEARRKHLQMDFAARIRAREEELANRQQEVATEAAEVREIAMEARVRLTWRGKAPSIDSIRKELVDFELVSMEIGESSAIVQLSSREMALRAVLECKARKHQMPFKVAMAPQKKDDGKEPAASKPSIPVKEAPKAEQPGGSPFSASNDADRTPQFGKSASFDDWEAQMMADLQNLAKKQQAQ
eukprot:TRINITY_DN38761_c0_g1_i1.p1 TRINITY_DN38761_c0_g1~~TRINITY_DN38761_c0_g1_i1.p1  ORF type:complete len:306 (+),score=88.92 TRINITY_DN38761_c0_g1_i1:60-977(+)